MHIYPSESTHFNCHSSIVCLLLIESCRNANISIELIECHLTTEKYIFEYIFVYGSTQLLTKVAFEFGALS